MGPGDRHIVSLQTKLMGGVTPLFYELKGIIIEREVKALFLQGAIATRLDLN